MRRLKGSERTDWSTEPEASFSPEQFQANECTFFLWPRYSLVSRPPGQSLVVRSMVPRAARRDAERRRREDLGEKKRTIPQASTQCTRWDLPPPTGLSDCTHSVI